ncbi:hypothetical protein [Streptomyces collinus]|uniref:hypothetical protein n=1 Tax=Streptomyces collinus TaxID=42684 RepID=UPI0033167E1B
MACAPVRPSGTRPGPTGPLGVVEADDRDVAGDAGVEVEQGVQGAEGRTLSVVTRPRRHTLHTTYIDRESTGPAPARVRRLRAPSDSSPGADAASP